MSARSHAVRVGVARGLTETRLSLRAPEDLTFYLVSGLGVLAYLFVNRHETVEGTTLSLPTLAMPGVLAGMVVFGAVIGPAFALVIEREDGTLLRARAAPYGIVGYVAGQATLQTLGVLPMLAVLLVPSAFLFDGVMHRGASGWLAVACLLVLGLVAGIPLGMIMGSVARKPSHVSTWGMLPVLVLAGISGIFSPITSLWGWVQGVAQVFPMYWLGTAMRWAFLPDEAKALEIGGRWHILEAVGVIGLWAAVGLLLAPRVLRRMARRESGSSVEARRQERMQRIG